MIKDLTEGKITKTLILFALPMLVGNIVQQIYNIADTIIVGKFISETALASVGAAFPIFFLLISIPIGLATGASVIMSQLFGAKKNKDVKKASYTALIAAGILGIIVSLIGIFLCKPILNLLNTPEDIIFGSQQYLQIIFACIGFLFVYDMATSTFNALGDSRTPLVFLIISALLNIGLDLLFVIRFGWGISGAAFATGISRIVATILAVRTLLRRLKKFNTEKIDKFFDFSLLKSMTGIAIPAMLNHSLVAVGALAIQAVINSFGSNIIAGYTAASKVDTLAMMPIMNLSFALATFAAQNLGSGQVDRAKKGFKSALIISICFSIFMATIILLWGEEIMRLFLDSEINNEITTFGKEYLMVVAFGYVIMGFLFDSGAILRASGTMKPFVISTIISIGAKIAAAYLLVGTMGQSVIWRSVIIGRGIGAIISMGAYLRGKWQETKIIQNSTLKIEMEGEEEINHLD